MNLSTSSCDDVLEMLPLHVGGDLEPASGQAVARHVERCSSCRVALARASSARDALVSGLEQEVQGGGPALWPSIRAELVRADVLAERAGSGRVLSGPWRRVAAGLVAAAALALFVAPRFLASDDPHTPAVVDHSPSAPLPTEVRDASESAPRIAESEAAPREGAPARGGLVPIRSSDELLRPELGPGSDPGLKLSSSNSPVR